MAHMSHLGFFQSLAAPIRRKCDCAIAQLVACDGTYCLAGSWMLNDGMLVHECSQWVKSIGLFRPSGPSCRRFWVVQWMSGSNRTCDVVRIKLWSKGCMYLQMLVLELSHQTADLNEITVGEQAVW